MALRRASSQSWGAWAASGCAQRRCSSAAARGAFYSGFAAPGLQYGPAFRTVEAAWVCGAEVTSRLVRRTALRGTQVHPADLDAALCVVALASRGGDGSVALDGGAIRTAGGDVYEVVRLKNRFKEPKFNGYRDALYSIAVRVAVEGGGEVWHVCEVQLHLAAVLANKEPHATVLRPSDDSIRP